ncbi:hypothetical protein CL620_00315 [archaeon]|nr:hypothetical protein [archaeon]
MLLKELTLRNIRSYENQTVNFTEGSTLLSGDIGSGKSSLLLAIEFALFGTSRPDLPGELLMRKGTISSSVTLRFQIQNQDITIQRNLKKEKAGIKQLPGHIIQNGVKKDLTAVELKSAIINVLGYPTELVSKNKNFIFRYTVYTPQETMKLILQDNAETRLDVLRKIFNIDKYKIIRENMQLYLKSTRAELTRMTGMLEPFEPEKQRLEEIRQRLKMLTTQITTLQPKIDLVTTKRLHAEQESNKMEEKQRHLHKTQELYKTSMATLQEKRGQQERLQKQIETLQSQLGTKPTGNVLELERHIKEKEHAREDGMKQEAQLQQTISQCQKSIRESQHELAQLAARITVLPEKKTKQMQYQEELRQKEMVETHITKLDKKKEDFTITLTQHGTLIAQATERQTQLQSLEQCPTCLQHVGEEHKKTIHNEAMNDISKSTQMKTRLQEELRKVQEEYGTYITKRADLHEKESMITKLSVEIDHLNQLEQQHGKKKRQLIEIVQQNNRAMGQLTVLQETNKHEIYSQEIATLRTKMDELRAFTVRQSQLGSLQKQQKEVLDATTKIQKQSDEARKIIEESEEFGDAIAYWRKELTSIREQEKELIVHMAALQSEQAHTTKNEGEIAKKVLNLTTIYETRVRMKETYHWLDTCFIPTTTIIEKHVMIRIHSLFNDLFQEWFSILIDDDTIHARIDDAFSPIIEQNGYEVSFTNLSGGEKTSASLAYRLALNRVINDVIHHITTKDLLILDEPTDGFSAQQLDKVRDVLDALQLRQTIIVSHENKIESFVENVLRVRKNEHVSEIM